MQPYLWEVLRNLITNNWPLCLKHLVLTEKIENQSSGISGSIYCSDNKGKMGDF